MPRLMYQNIIAKSTNPPAIWGPPNVAFEVDSLEQFLKDEVTSWLMWDLETGIDDEPDDYTWLIKGQDFILCCSESPIRTFVLQ